MSVWDPSLSPERANALFRAITEAADNANISLSIFYAEEGDFRLVYINPGTEKLLGYPIAEVAARSVWGFFPEDELPRIIEMHRKRMAGEDIPDTFETIVVHQDGRRIPVEVATSRIALDGKPANATFLFDISHRKAAEIALRESEERFRSSIENAPDGVAILRWPEILFANSAAARMLGFHDPQDVVGTNMTDYLRPVDVPRAEERARRRAEGDHSLEAEAVEYITHDPNGRPLTVEVSTIRIDYEGGPAVLSFARDVTERNAIREQLVEADKFAAVGMLAAGVAHEINNPLAYMLLNLEYLTRELPKAAADSAQLPVMMERLQDTRQGAERVRSIVSDLQTFTRRDENIRGPVDLESIIDRAVQIAGHNIRKNARFVRNVAQVPSVYGNATRLEQLFLNLLVNASHAVELGDGDKVIEVRVAAGPPGYVHAEVHDTGCGMSPETLERAFDPFFTTKPAGLGTGLGLPTCRRIVTAIGGDIAIESQQGEQTTVRVLLKLHAGDEVSGEIPVPLSTHINK